MGFKIQLLLNITDTKVLKLALSILLLHHRVQIQSVCLNQFAMRTQLVLISIVIRADLFAISTRPVKFQRLQLILALMST